MEERERICDRGPQPDTNTVVPDQCSSAAGELQKRTFYLKDIQQEVLNIKAEKCCRKSQIIYCMCCFAAVFFEIKAIK